MLGWTGAARAQSQTRLPRIGYLSFAPITDTPSPERAAFLQGLRELGYIDGKTITIEYQSGEMNVEMLPDAAAELVDRKVDLIVAAGTVATVAAKNATKSIPVVTMFSSEPVASGLACKWGQTRHNFEKVESDPNGTTSEASLKEMKFEVA